LASFKNWVYGIALSMGAPGLFVAAFLDSSFISLPLINDSLVVFMSVNHAERMPLYALLATGGSVAGCYAIYVLAERGGEAFLRKRLHEGHVERGLAVYRRNGLLALMVPALLPPPAPFKLFVLLAGVAEVRPLQFVTAIGIARGLRYLALGYLAIRYGSLAIEIMGTQGRDAALTLAAVIAAGAALYWLSRRQRR
jgi:membrane protein YqaA with SNARE-associated domain